MKFKAVEDLVGKVPYISKNNAFFIYNFIIDNNIKNILERGIAHGTATSYMAAALDELGAGKITAVDLESVKNNFNPSCEEQLQKCNLGEYVEIHRMKTGYNWFLHDEIKRNTTNNICNEKFDLCIIDGPKNWTIDSSAFFLVDKLLKKGGYIIFDDYSWTYEKANQRRTQTDDIVHSSLSIDEQSTPHIKEIFDLLVKQHPNYSEFRVFDDKQWAMARKVAVDKKTEIQKFNYYNPDNLIRKSNEISKIITFIENLKSQDNKYIIYGNGTLGRIIKKILDRDILFIDKNYEEINKENVLSLEEGLTKDFDKLIISTLGREDEVISNLTNNFSLDKDKIITLL